MSKQPVYFKNLDALRFYAFLCIFISHTITLPVSPVYPQIISDFVSELLVFYLGVPFFFTLSSFLVTYKILEEYWLNNKMQLFRFYLKRGLRIWPVYYLLLLICFAIMPLLFSSFTIKEAVLPEVFPFLLFWENFYMIQHGIHFFFPLIVLWSIAIEEQFYIFWGLILKFFKKYLLTCILLFLAASIIFCYYYLYSLHQDTFNLKLHSVFSVPSFCLGALMAFICHKKKAGFYFLKRLPSFFYTVIYFLLVAFYLFQRFHITSFDLVISALFNSACYALILFDQSFNDERIFNAGRFKLLNYLGKISYGLYIYHELVVSLVIKFLKFFKTGQPFGVTLLETFITLCITVFTAHISYQYFERFFLKQKERL